MSVELKERFLGRETPFISKADARIEQAVRVIQDDIEADADMKIFLRWMSAGGFRFFAAKGCSGDKQGVLLRFADSDCEKDHGYSDRRFKQTIFCFDLLAKHFGISETSLKNYFQGVYGRGYSELLNEIRMKKAAELILKNSMKISEISDAVGFATQSRFAKAFKLLRGLHRLNIKRKHNLNKDSRQMELSDNK